MTTTDPTPTTAALAIPDASPAIPSNWDASWRLAQRIASTPFVPGALRGRPESVLAAILYGSELGLGPMQSLNGIHVIDGRVAAAPELMRALIARAGHRLDVVEATDDHVTLAGRRADTGATASITWSIDDARRAGLLDKKGGSWRAYPRAMLLARATSELARTLFADVISGLSYTPDEVAAIDGSEWTASTEPSTEASPDPSLDVEHDPSPGHEPTIAPDELVERLRAIAGSELADQIKSVAASSGRRLSAADFAAHPKWAEVVAAALEDGRSRGLADPRPSPPADDVVDAELIDIDDALVPGSDGAS